MTPNYELLPETQRRFARRRKRKWKRRFAWSALSALAVGTAFGIVHHARRIPTAAPHSPVSRTAPPVVREVRLMAKSLPAARSTNVPARIVWKPKAELIWKAPAVAQTAMASPQPIRVALTFDAGSNADGVPMILQTLLAHNARATFFLTGKFCERFPKASRAIADAGMEIGNHSYSHPHFTRLDKKEIYSQVWRGEETIREICGRSAKPWFRFPYGDFNERTCQAVAHIGYQPIAWTLDSLDSVGEEKSADFVAERIISQIRPGYITLMHVSAKGSAQALPRIFAHLDKMGAQVVPISELLDAVAPLSPTGAPPAPGSQPTSPVPTITTAAYVPPRH